MNVSLHKSMIRFVLNDKDSCSLILNNQREAPNSYIMSIQHRQVKSNSNYSRYVHLKIELWLSRLEPDIGSVSGRYPEPNRLTGWVRFNRLNCEWFQFVSGISLASIPQLHRFFQDIFRYPPFGSGVFDFKYSENGSVPIDMFASGSVWVPGTDFKLQSRCHFTISIPLIFIMYKLPVILVEVVLL